MMSADALLISSVMIVKALQSMLTLLFVIGQGKCFSEVWSKECHDLNSNDKLLIL